MNERIRKADLDLLAQAGLAPEDVEHSVMVAGIALDIAKSLKTETDLELVARGALFHDLGKVRTSSIRHGLEGASIGEALGLPRPVLDIMEKHVRAGVPREQAAAYGLPDKDFSLTRIEEKLVIYADKLSDILEEQDLARDLDDARARFAGILSARPDLAKDEATRKRYLALRRDIEALAASE